MDKLTLENKRDFPLTTNALKFMQSAYAMLEKLAAIGGDNYIVSGCTVTGSSVSAGYMVLKGALMPFIGGSITTNVRIVKTIQTITVDIGSREETNYHAEFGTSANPDDNVPWANIKKIDTIISLMDAITSLGNGITSNGDAISALDDRIDDLEAKTTWLSCSVESSEISASGTIAQVRKSGSIVTITFAIMPAVTASATGVVDILKLPNVIPGPSGLIADVGVFFALAGDAKGVRATVLSTKFIRIFDFEDMTPGSYYHGTVSYIV